MKYYPINLNINNKNCLVVGAGRVGIRKVKTLLTCGAKVTVVSNEVCDEIKDLAKSGQIELFQKPYDSMDLEKKFLVICATNNEIVNEEVAKDAHKRNLLCNIADRPKLCNFILPAIVQQEDLVITISTSGKSPAFAKFLKDKLENEYGEEYGHFLNLMGKIRGKLLSEEHAPEEHKGLFEALIKGNLLGMIKDSKWNEVDDSMFKVLGFRRSDL